jgi:hypothetical protein
LIPIPILKVLSSFQKMSAQALLMGGQACVFYGAAEFSRDTDFAVLAEASNLEAIRRALDELQAEVIAVPPFEAKYLERGHAIHFRCGREDVRDMRVDIMSKMRGVDAFQVLWNRRTEMESSEGIFQMMGLPDLVQAKKTQRDKDWPMIRRLVDRNYFTNRENPSSAQIEFWFKELRTPELLIEVAKANGDQCERLTGDRPLLVNALSPNLARLEEELDAEEKRERAADRAYWRPLREELESMRRARLRSH